MSRPGAEAKASGQRPKPSPARPEAEAIARVELEVCGDCVMWIANRDDTGSAEDFHERFDAGTEGLADLTIDDTEDYQAHFSAARCHLCGALAGDRYPASARWVAR